MCYLNASDAIRIHRGPEIHVNTAAIPGKSHIKYASN